MRFTIIIVHRNGSNRLEALVNTAINVMSPHDEIIIVDNASTDQSITHIAKIFPKIRIIKNNFNLGYGHAANQGMNIGKGKYFLICNNDITLPINILTELENLFEKEPKAGIISGQQTNFDGEIIRTSSRKPSLLSEFDGVARIDHSKDPLKISEVGILRGACLGVNKIMVDEIGGYDEDFFFYFEDTEWCIRAYRSGWKVFLHPKIKIPHLSGASTREFFKESRIEFYRSRMKFWEKIFPKSIVTLLYLWNIPKLFLDLILYTFIVIITFGQSERLKKKMIDRCIVLLWLALAKPNSWGLPKN